MAKGIAPSKKLVATPPAPKPRAHGLLEMKPPYGHDDSPGQAPGFATVAIFVTHPLAYGAWNHK